MRLLARALACALAMSAAVSAAGAPPAAAAESRAVVVIDTGSGSRRAVITFSGTISGIKALELAGANPATYGFAGQGAAVCAIDGVGHQATSGECLGTPSDPRYWAYFRAVDGANGWSYSHECACSTTVSDGDVEGWRFGTGQQPPFASFCAVVGCAPPPTAAPAQEPGGGSSPGGATAAGSNGSGTAGSGTSAAPAPNVDNGAPTAGSADPAVATTAPATVSTTAGRSDSRADRESALGVRPRGGDDGAGSPWGVIVAVAVVAMLGLLALFVRRRRPTA